jgi:hypothetical protein
VEFSPRVHERLVEAVWRLDDDRQPIAETWRRVGREAAALGLPRPGYHAVRVLVAAERIRRSERARLTLDAIESLWAFPGPDVADLTSRFVATRRPPAGAR